MNANSERERSFAYDFGLPLETSEMPREKFISRLHADEKKVLKDLCSNLSSIVRNLDYGLIAVGSATYSDEWYLNLEKYLQSRSLSRSDVIEERSSVVYQDSLTKLLTQSTSYELFCIALEKYNQDNFDSPCTISEKYFMKFKKNFQPEYSVEKSIESILTNKGEDINIVLALDSISLNKKRGVFFIPPAHLCKRLSARYHVPLEESYLSGHSYKDTPEGGAIRIKTISRTDISPFSLETSQRRIHVYVDNSDLPFQIRQNIVDNVSFSRLVRHGQFHEFSSLL